MHIKRTGYIGIKAGLVLGAIYSFGGLIIDSLVSMGYLSPAKMGTTGLSYGSILAFGALIGLPVIGGTIGAIIAAVSAMIRSVIQKF